MRTARLTKAGLAERKVLERRSDELAQSILAPLSESQRERLVAALTEAERLLGVALVRFRVVDALHRDAQHCLEAYAGELDRRVGGASTRLAGDRGEPRPASAAARHCSSSRRFMPSRSAAAAEAAAGPAGRGEADVGLGERARPRARPPATRRARAARRRDGRDSIRLETNGALTEAIALYRSSGYEEIEPFNDEPYAHHWFGKPLPPVASPQPPNPPK